MASKLTEWEAGQELIRANDCLAEVAHELNEGGFPELAKAIREHREQIAKLFEEHGSHEFGL